VQDPVEPSGKVRTARALAQRHAKVSDAMKRSALKSRVFAVGAKLKLDKKFQPCAAEPGDELYPNGMFVFNITRLLAFIETHAERFPVESIKLADIPDYGNDGSLDQEAIDAADTLRPILMAEIAPGYNLIDGHHRVARARLKRAVGRGRNPLPQT
jgi:hypothetical protein